MYGTLNTPRPSRRRAVHKYDSPVARKAFCRVVIRSAADTTAIRS
jgi:hypothetical protein